jgi:hypothetical protein
MSARKSPTFSKPSTSNLRIQQGRIQASESEGRKSGAHTEDERFQIAPIVVAEENVLDD